MPAATRAGLTNASPLAPLSELVEEVDARSRVPVAPAPAVFPTAIW